MHACDKGDLLGFTCGEQTGVEVFEDGVEACADQCCDVQDTAHVGSPAEDVALASEGAGIAVDGGQADQGGDLLACTDGPAIDLKRVAFR